jgi:hypothetical protein
VYDVHPDETISKEITMSMNRNSFVVNCNLFDFEKSDWQGVSERIRREGITSCTVQLDARTFSYDCVKGLNDAPMQCPGAAPTSMWDRRIQ